MNRLSSTIGVLARPAIPRLIIKICCVAAMGMAVTGRDTQAQDQTISGNLTVSGVTRATAFVSSNRSAVGLEHNILFGATVRFAVSQSGPAPVDLGTLFDGYLAPSYSDAPPTAQNPQVITIEDLPAYHTQAGCWVGWTTRYWAPTKFKIEGYETYYHAASPAWVTLADYSTTAYGLSDFTTSVPAGSYTKLKVSIYEAAGAGGRFGLSELFYIQPEGSRPYSGLVPAALYEGRAGYVGIGTANPQAPLHIARNGQAEVQLENESRRWSMLCNSGWGGNGLSLYDITADAPRLLIDTSGRVGISTTTPTATLDVAGAAVVRGNLTVNGLFSAPSYTTTSGVLTGGASGLALNAGGTNQNVVIAPSGVGATLIGGNVGIGFNAPDRTLDVRQPSGTQMFNVGVLEDGGRGLLVIPSGSGGVGTALLTSNGSSYALTFGINGVEKARLDPNGNLGIGTASPGNYKLAVNGTVHAKEVVVDTTIAANDIRVRPAAWADDVFAESRRLAPLSEVERHIVTEKHLPGIPSAAEVAAEGVNLGEMQSALLRKIEELTLHQIEQEKAIAVLRGENDSLRTRLQQLERNR